MNQNDVDFFAKLLFGEAAAEGGENLELKRDAMVAIANTIQNRAKISGQSLIYEATKPGQYTSYALQTYWRDLDRWIRSPGNRSAYQVAREVAMDLVDGKLKDTTGGATFYYNPKQVRTPRHLIGIKPIKTVGDHIFFKDISPYTKEEAVKPKPQPKPEPVVKTEPVKAMPMEITPEHPVMTAKVSTPKVEVGKTSPEEERFFGTLERVKSRSQMTRGLSDRVSRALQNWLDVLPSKDLKKAKSYLGKYFPKQKVTFE